MPVLKTSGGTPGDPDKAKADVDSARVTESSVFTNHSGASLLRSGRKRAGTWDLQPLQIFRRPWPRAIDFDES